MTGQTTAETLYKMNKMKTEILKALAGHQEEIRRKYKAEVKGLFGSFARGEERGDSDVDILVDFTEHADLFDYVGLGLFLEEKLNRKIDVVPQSSLRKEIKANVLRELVLI